MLAPKSREGALGLDLEANLAPGQRCSTMDELDGIDPWDLPDDHEEEDPTPEQVEAVGDGEPGWSLEDAERDLWQQQKHLDLRERPAPRFPMSM